MTKSSPMIESVGRRLRIIMTRAPEVPPNEVAAPPRPSPSIEFVAFAEDCLLAGQVQLGTTRLTDMLLAHDEYQLVDVLLESLAGGPPLELAEVLVTRDELLLVQASGPRGDRGRRVRTRQHRLEMQSGPYRVGGYIHALPGVDPVSSFRHRRAIVPLTDVSVEFALGGIRQVRRAQTLLVNRELVDWVAAAPEEAFDVPELFIEHDKGPLLKDFTGHVLDRPGMSDSRTT